MMTLAMGFMSQGSRKYKRSSQFIIMIEKTWRDEEILLQLFPARVLFQASSLLGFKYLETNVLEL